MKLVILVLAALAACSPMAYNHGVPNLYKVNAGVWRSGQITTVEGWEYVKAVTQAKRLHVIKLNFDDEGSDELALQLGIDVFDLAIQPAGDQGFWRDIADVFETPNKGVVGLAIALLEHASSDDVFLVHCTHGQDRTGFVIGVYRVLIEGWSPAVAYAEMLDHDFHAELPALEWAWEHFAEAHE